ncbi:peptidase domain-containing ABC transporter [Aquirufa antheringensis]|jgi:ATP-binding cassette, subfamily B, bacterial|uniref:peptidase domain-containing ABC transporter n=1 Tax=Aquirufa antheringensis TaxID=2516559 RepID=UPI001032B0F4|nr:ABC transporter ATP-binding protein [Aquirufa antheringensis]MCE4217506.1 ATP-binding cassette domain-containing protein [Pseudarcicella sp. GAP-15]MCZ2477937.1 ABC transporter ATP-binding protein [Aquirufa antheringensis]MCZ2487023.1 ABC transporter ATP-binding protein [Aquirufa antheringensis]MCZ2489990.1 ABC transporter ATP-binding protein [Aquirufa antheringensis]TBH71666.1 ABC transporter ATP-binding protein [Aquirufa antheringensis]
MQQISPLKRVQALIQDHKKEITSIYLFSILGGIVNLSLPLGVQTIIGLVMGATMVTSIYVLIFLVVLGVFLMGLFQINQMKIIESIQQKIFAHYAYDFAQKLPSLDLKQMDKYHIPEKVNRFFDTLNIQKGFAKLLLDIPVATVQIVFGIILLSLYHPLFIILGLILLLLLGLILFYTSKKGIETSIEESTYKYEVAGFFGEIARTIKTFKFSQGSDLNLIRTDENVMGYLAARTTHFHVLLFQYKSLIFFKIALTTLMLTLGSYLLINQQLNVGEFVAAEIVIMLVIGAVEKLITSLDSAYDVFTGLEKLASVTDSPLETSGELTVDTQEGLEIEMKNFSFEFEPGKPVLHSINLHINPGEKIQIAGPAGAGKSILMRVLTGNYIDFKGTLLINKVPIKNYSLASLRKHTGILLQNQEIFKGTVWENISLGNKDISPSMILATANELGFADFLNHFTKGFDTDIEPLGKKTPQSIVKKILLLRALCGDKRLVLLENPWSGLEPELAKRIQAYLVQLKATVLVSTNENGTFGKKIEINNGKV